MHLLTLTEKEKEKGGKKMEERKPIVLVTARVHPGEVSSSYVFQGMM